MKDEAIVWKVYCLSWLVGVLLVVGGIVYMLFFGGHESGTEYGEVSCDPITGKWNLVAGLHNPGVIAMGLGVIIILALLKQVTPPEKPQPPRQGSDSDHGMIPDDSMSPVPVPRKSYPLLIWLLFKKRIRRDD